MVIHSLQNNKFAGGQQRAQSIDTHLLAIQRYCIQFGDNVDLFQNFRLKKSEWQQSNLLKCVCVGALKTKIKKWEFFVSFISKWVFL